MCMEEELSFSRFDYIVRLGDEIIAFGIVMNIVAVIGASFLELRCDVVVCKPSRIFVILDILVCPRVEARCPRDHQFQKLTKQHFFPSPTLKTANKKYGQERKRRDCYPEQL